MNNKAPVRRGIPLAAGLAGDWVESWRGSAATAWVVFKTCIEERLVYRGDFFFSTFVRFLPIITQVFLWYQVFRVGSEAEISQLNGYGYRDMVAYFLLAMVARAFSSMPGLASGIALDIRDGGIKKYILQPIDLVGYLFWHRVAHKLVYYLIAAVPFGVVFWLLGDFFPEYPPFHIWICFLVSLVLAFLIGFLLEALIGLIGFWFLEVSSLLFIYMMLNYFLSGQMIPLDWLPPAVTMWVHLLPFQYLAYFPAALYLGKIPEENLGRELCVMVLWVVVLYLANRVALRRGLKRYGAYGG